MGIVLGQEILLRLKASNPQTNLTAKAAGDACRYGPENGDLCNLNLS